MPIVIATLMLVVSVSFSSISAHKQLASCLCTDNVQFNNRLPQSHPANRCATQQSTVSWSSWLFGSGNSRQFHYLDLLELLSRSSDIVEQTPHQS